MDRKEMKKRIAGLSDEEKDILREELGVKSSANDKDILEAITSMQTRLEALEGKKADDEKEEKPEEKKTEKKSGLAGLFDVF